MWNKTLICLLLAAFTMAGCSTKRKVEKESVLVPTASNLKTVLHEVEANKAVFDSFSGKAKTQLVVKGKSFNATTSVRIKQDEAIWVSITAILGIEVARVLITPDRIQVINRIQGEYIDKPFNEVYKYTGNELSFSDLTDLLVGNIPSFTLKERADFVNTSLGYQLSGSHEGLEYSVLIGQNFKADQVELKQSQLEQTFSSEYSQYTSVEAQSLPSSVGIRINSPGLELQLQMNYSSLTLNQTESMPFSVPSGYKQR